MPKRRGNRETLILPRKSPISRGFRQGSRVLRGHARLAQHCASPQERLNRMTASEQVTSFLLELMERRGAVRVIEVPMRRSDIADYVGISLPAVSRSFRTLTSRNIVRFSDRRHLNPPAPSQDCGRRAGAAARASRRRCRRAGAARSRPARRARSPPASWPR
ncbi:MAG: helix-turn-helix domain-containing protein, partial [Stellaceae bacterium]